MRQQWVHAMAWYLEYSRDTHSTITTANLTLQLALWTRWSQVYGRGENRSDTLASHLSHMIAESGKNIYEQLNNGL